MTVTLTQDANGKFQMSQPEFPTNEILALACAAQRVNGSYVKETEFLFSDDNKVLARKEPNKYLMLVSLALVKPYDPENVPARLIVTDADRTLAKEIKDFYRRLLFAAVAGENEFQTNLNSILGADTVSQNRFGFLACLPSLYARDLPQNQVKKQAKKVEEGFLAEIGTNLFDLDCEILESAKSKNFEAFNITAIIDNKMVSWMSKYNLKLGPCVVVKAKVKEHSAHWKHGNSITRLNYVKAAQ